MGTAVAVKKQGGAVMTKMELVPVELIGEAAGPDLALDAEWRTAESAGGDLVPTAKWMKAGESIWGVYRGARGNVGPNNSMMYHIQLADGEGLTAGVWGSTVLDQAMKDVDPKVGDRILIAYLGDRPTARGQQDAHIFKVLVRRRG